MGGTILDLLCRCFSLTPQPTLFRQDTPLRGNQPGQKLTMGEPQTAGGRLFMHQYYLSPAAVPPSVDRPLRGNTLPGDGGSEEDFLCWDVGVPPDESYGPWGNTSYLKHWTAVPPMVARPLRGNAASRDA